MFTNFGSTQFTCSEGHPIPDNITIKYTRAIPDPGNINTYLLTSSALGCDMAASLVQ